MKTTLLILAVISLAALGCAHKPVPVVEMPQVPVIAVAVPAPTPPHPADWCDAATACPDGQVCVNNHCIPVPAPAPLVCDLASVHFDFDSALIRDSEKSVVEHDADCLNGRRTQIRIEGNCDERGTEEYNLALGDARAVAVARYFKARGIAPKRLRTTSYGETRPLCTDHDEACWQRNRRAELR